MTAAQGRGYGRGVRSPRSLALLLFGMLLSLAALGVFGVRAWRVDQEEARARYESQARAMTRSLKQGIARAIESLDASKNAVAWSASPTGQLLQPLPVEFVLPDAEDAALRDTIAVEIDTLDRMGRSHDADLRLAQLSERTDRSGISAWGSGWIAARALRAGNTALARTAWDRVARESPNLRDERGLPVALAARNELAALDADPVEALMELHGALLRARASLDDTATAFLTLDVEERVAKRDEASAELLRADRVRATRALRVAAAWQRGAAERLDTNSERTSWRMLLPQDPLVVQLGASEVLFFARSTPQGWFGAAAELDDVLAAVLSDDEIRSWNELGFGAQVLDGNGSLMAGESMASDLPQARETLDAPLEGCTVRCSGLRFDEFVASEHRRFMWLVGVGVLVFTAASIAAFATVRAVTQEARLAREREQFVAAVTHELKTPIASIRLLAELLESGTVPNDKARDFGRRTVREADRLARLVDGVLRYARVESGLDGSSRTSEDLRALTQEALDSVQPLAEERGFELRSQVESESVCVDRDAIVGALAELLDNATKYGDPIGGVDVRSERGETWIRLYVEDRGQGIEPERRETVFEPFRRLGDESTREQRGVGLGLALVRSVARAHGGDVRCEARVGGGARFMLEIRRGFQA